MTKNRRRQSRQLGGHRRAALRLFGGRQNPKPNCRSGRCDYRLAGSAHGTRTAQHARLTIDAGLEVLFDPRAPDRTGTNEEPGASGRGERVTRRLKYARRGESGGIQAPAGRQPRCRERYPERRVAGPIAIANYADELPRCAASRQSMLATMSSSTAP